MIMRHFFSPHNGVKVNIDSLLISDWLMRATPSEIWDERGLVGLSPTGTSIYYRGWAAIYYLL